MTESQGGAGGAGSAAPNLAPNIASLLCYLLMAVTCGAPVAGIVFLVIEKGQPDVKFHAWQSIVLGAALWIAYIVTTGLWYIVPLFGFVFRMLGFAVGCAGLAVWIVCLIKAYQGERWRIPFLGDIAAKQAGV
ncbi:MAG: DUF4870 domain-containing protein [Deltaproteobacteria bacterium]|nr:DUF4870 domain-containing protein [Deltaproteobacteria bacterium]